ncbi:hypothetical protein [Deinococcus multiflagellatus]|uniref:hypothetical protein n=1 Tax=Deinococcus multiflagellatus TaxID=1656887 RepID=UPI001CCF9CD0|nr:hypothetical protein [Deinococcus multiflagellatus]MBZ9715334.1 hypothetical protein [Deinococcus multiflagellatus]
MTARTQRAGTFVPATLSDLVPDFEAEALREGARALLRRADALDGRCSRVTFLAVPSGQCANCQELVTGDRCPNCQLEARP